MPFKDRSFLSPKPWRLVYGTVAVTAVQQVRIEGVYVKKLRLKLRKFVKKKKKQHRPKKSRPSAWIRYNPNVFLTKKSKNARMGSGKGKFVRRACRITALSPIMEFRQFKPTWCRKFHAYLLNRWGLECRINATKETGSAPHKIRFSRLALLPLQQIIYGRSPSVSNPP